jgi:hypothetical protein
MSTHAQQQPSLPAFNPTAVIVCGCLIALIAFGPDQVGTQWLEHVGFKAGNALQQRAATPLSRNSSFPPPVARTTQCTAQPSRAGPGAPTSSLNSCGAAAAQG